MAPNNTELCEMVDMRVPPPFITDVEVLDYFPELLSNSQGFAPIFRDGQRLKRGSRQKYKKQKEQILSNTVNSIHGTFDIESHDQYISCSRRTNSSKFAFLEERRTDIFKHSDVIISSENGDWCQIPRGDSDETEFRVVDGTDIRVEDKNKFEVVDVPCFGDDVSNPSLWEDVDTFVSVVDVSGSDVVEEETEPVYIIDTHVSSVWGLDIIWEDEEYL